MKTYIFGYGSLVNRRSLEFFHNNELIPVTVSNIQRGWFLNIQEDRNTGLGAVFNQGSKCNGVLIEVTNEELLNIDKRELIHGYNKFQLSLDDIKFWTLNSSSLINTSIWIYLTDTPDNPSNKFPIAQSYLDVVMEGFIDFGVEFAKNFIHETTGWKYPWIDDRDNPRYRRSKGVDYSMIDTLLMKELKDKFNNRKPAPNNSSIF